MVYTITLLDKIASDVNSKKKLVFRFEIQYSGFVNNETASVLTTAPTASCTATSSSVPGTYDITVSGGAATNYDFTYVNGTLTINQFNGDVNGDGVIDIADAVMIVNYIVGKLGTQSRE